MAWCWKRASLQLLAPAAVLPGALGIVASMYFVSQNWLQTILPGDYVAYLYIPYLAVALAFMTDVVFNRARYSKLLVSGILAAAGATAAAVCQDYAADRCTLNFLSHNSLPNRIALPPAHQRGLSPAAGATVAAACQGCGARPRREPNAIAIPSTAE